MTSALRLVRDHAFDVLELQAIRWQAAVGNWGSRRTAAAAGFRFDGTVRSPAVPSRRAAGRLAGNDHRRGPRVGSVLALAAEAVERPDHPPAVHRGRSGPHRRGVRRSRDGRTGWSPSPSPTVPSTPRATWRVYVRWRRVGPAGPGASPMPTDRCLGAVSLEGFGGYARRLEIGYWAHPDARGQGVMSEAVRVVTAHVEGQDLADSVIIRCAAGNLASRRVAEAAGYVRNGVQPASDGLAATGLVDAPAGLLDPRRWAAGTSGIVAVVSAIVVAALAWFGARALARAIGSRPSAEEVPNGASWARRARGGRPRRRHRGVAVRAGGARLGAQPLRCGSAGPRRAPVAVRRHRLARVEGGRRAHARAARPRPRARAPQPRARTRSAAARVGDGDRGHDRGGRRHDAAVRRPARGAGRCRARAARAPPARARGRRLRTSSSPPAARCPTPVRAHSAARSRRCGDERARCTSFARLAPRCAGSRRR